MPYEVSPVRYPVLRKDRFPFDDMTPGSDDQFFVPLSDYNGNMKSLRSAVYDAARTRGYSISIRALDQENNPYVGPSAELGVRVWVKGKKDTEAEAA